jgi:hypothetical protein
MLGIESFGPIQREGRYKPTKHEKVDKPFSVEEAQHANREVNANTAAEKIAQAPKVQKSDTISQVIKPETLARPISKADIVDQLLQIKKPPTVENQLIISALLEHGIEASEDNFNAIAKFLKGKGKGNTIESAVLALTKGLGNSSKSVDILSQFLANSTQMSQQLKQTQTALSNFYTMLQFSKDLFNTNLFTGFASIIADSNDELKKLLKKSSKIDTNSLNFDRKTLISNLKSLHAFLGGIGQKLSDPKVQQMPLAKALQEQLRPLQKALSSLLEAITSQAILSKDSILQTSDKYAYWQFPNPMAKVKSDIDLLIKKASNKNKGNIDPDKTKIVIKLETPDIGKLGVIVNVEEKNVAYTFQTTQDDTKKNIIKSTNLLKDRMESINYSLVGCRTTTRKTDIKKHLFPTFNLDALSRIRTEV